MRSVRSSYIGPGTSPSDSDGELDLRALGLALWRRKSLIIAPTIVVAVAAFFFVNSISPQYRSEAKIMVEGRENVFLRPEAEKSLDRAAADQETIATQVQVIQSRDIARQVIRELKLNERPDFDPVLSGVSPVRALLSVFGIGRDRLRMTPEERVMEAYFSRLNVTALERSRVITIEFSSGDPELSARVVNAVVDAYLKMQLLAKQEQVRSASAYLASEIETLRKTVLEADAKVEEFRAKANLFVGANDTSLANQQLGELTTQLAAARAQKADLDAKSRLIRDMLKSGRPVESSDIANSDLLRRLIEQRVLLRAQLAEQSSTLLSRHPRILELNAQIDALDQQIRGELQRAVVSLENDARIAAARVEATNDDLERLKKQVGGTSSQDVQLRALEREAKAQRDLLESYLARYREATARENIGGSPAEVRVISRAIVSNVPAFPKKLPIVMIATLATAFLSAAFVLSAEILKQGGGRPAALPVAPQSPPRHSKYRDWLLANLLRRKKASADRIEPATLATNDASKAFGAVPIADLVKALSDLGETGRRITVVGAARNVGTTHTALGVARRFAADGSRVVLVDLALEAPNLALMSVDPQAPGLADLVRGTASFGEIVTRDKFSRVHLIATGHIAGDAASICASPRLAIVLQALARAYDHVVIDAGALSEAAVEPLAPITPCAILVATDVEHPDTKAARERLAAAGFADVMVLLGTPSSTSAESVAA